MVWGGRLKVIVAVTVALVMVVGVLPMQTYAELSEEDKFIYGENGIYYYDEKGSKCGSGSYVGGPIVISGTNIKEKIWSGLTSFLTEEQSAGVMGNMQSESNSFNPAQHEVDLMRKYQPGFDLGANEDVSYGLGLIQWSFGRRVSMYHYVGDTDSNLLEFFNNYDTYSPDYSLNGDGFLELAGDEATNALLSLEIQFLKDELENTYTGLFNTTTVEEATRYFLESVEIPANPTLDAHPERLTQAEAIYAEFAGSSPSGSSGSSGSGGCLTNSGALEEYVRKYVWPEYRKVEGQNYTNRMPDYADAVNERKLAGKFVGGDVDGVAGIDCGGFVTTIMQESGYDTNYNGCGSNVATQEYWIREGDGAANWEWLNPNEESMDAGDLQLGDVAFVGDYTGGCIAGGDHTFMFIGNLDGYETNIASASYTAPGNTNGRAPMSGYESVSGVRWYRKVK